jgi:hypothetical protein
VAENSYDQRPNEGREALYSDAVDQHVNKKRKTDKNVSTARGYTDSDTRQSSVEDQQMAELQKKVEELEAFKRMFCEQGNAGFTPPGGGYLVYSNKILSAIEKGYVFDGENKDPQQRLESYTTFKAKLKLATQSLSKVPPEVKENAIKEALPQIMGGTAVDFYQAWNARGWNLERIWKAFDQLYYYRDDMGTLINRAIQLPIFDDNWTDGIKLAKSYKNWSKIADKMRGWSVEKFVFEFMKGQVRGKDTIELVSKMTECGIEEFFDQIFQFESARKPQETFIKDGPEAGNQFEVNAVTVADKRGGSRPQTWKARKRTSKRGYEELWEALCKKRNIPNSEANRKLAKNRFDSRSCLYCGQGMHSCFTCGVSEKTSGYFRN